MYEKIILLLTLMAFALVASQPLFYLMALGPAQQGLRATAYIELRKGLDKTIKPVLQALYFITLLLTSLLAGLSLYTNHLLLLAAAIVALVALVVDIALALKTNIPINNIINQWDADNYPRHWQLFRKKWFHYYRIRQVAGLIGFAALLFGVVFGSYQ